MARSSHDVGRLAHLFREMSATRRRLRRRPAASPRADGPWEGLEPLEGRILLDAAPWYSLDGAALVVEGTPGNDAFTFDASGAILAGAGSAALPTYSFVASGENDKGVYSDGANSLGLAVAGTRALKITSGRRVQLDDGGVLTNVAGVHVSTSDPVSEDDVEGTIWCKV